MTRLLTKPSLFLAIAAYCLFAFVLRCQSETFRELTATFPSLQWMLLTCLSVWYGTFLFLTFSLRDLALTGLLLLAIVEYFFSEAKNLPVTDAFTLLFGVTLGRGAKLLLSEDASVLVTRRPSLVTFLVGLILLLLFASWWHPNMSDNIYHGPRWMGLWNNPNDYGLLMGAGVVLAAGLLAERLKAKGRRLKKEMEGNLKSERLKAEMGKRKLLQILKTEKLKAEIGEERAETGSLKSEESQKEEIGDKKILATKRHKDHKENSHFVLRFLRILRLKCLGIVGDEVTSLALKIGNRKSKIEN